MCVTAQHRQMLDQVLELFQINPDYDLDLMRDNQSLAQISISIFTHLDPVLARFQPDWVLVVGDTTTVVTTSVLCYYRRIRVGHVEAGLRTHNKWHPFPEELNRRIATVIADLHFAPTEWSKANLLRRRRRKKHRRHRQSGHRRTELCRPAGGTARYHRTARQTRDKRTRDQATHPLVTAHRRENFGQPFENLCLAIRELHARMWK